MSETAIFRSSCRAAWLSLLLAPLCLAQEIRYDWLTADQVSGAMVLRIGDDGRRVADFGFNDRGRGPKLLEEIVPAADGSLGAISVSGRSYMGAPVRERYAVEDGIGRWESTLESGTAAAANHWYLPAERSPEQYAALARALLAAPGGRLSLLPSGAASIRALQEHTLPGGGPTVTLYAITGLDLSPQYLWLDERGELFALTLGWMGLAPQGQGAVLKDLQPLQDEAEQAHHRERAAALTETLPGHWILRNVSVLDVASGALRPGQAVAVENGRIARVADDRDLGLPPRGELQPRVIDGQGLVLMPGLWDMHVHLSLDSGLLHVAAGVTSVRDLGNDPAQLARFRQAYDSGEVIGPRIHAAGFIDKRSPYSAPTGRLADTLDDALAMLREYAASGYAQVKIYSSIDPGWVKPLAAEAHKLGMRLSGHIPSYMTARQAVLDGFDEIQHVNMLFLNFLAGPEDDTRTPLRFSRVAKRAADLDLDSQPVVDFIGLLRERGVTVDPTVTIFDSLFRHRSGQPDPSYAMIAAHLPPELRRGLLAGRMDIDDDNAATYARSADALLEMIGRLHATGVTLVAGTDAMAGFTLHRELELYCKAGIPNAEVLRIATLGAATVAGVADESGSIEVGKRADFVLLAGNPLEDISAVRLPVAVFRGERWYDSARLYEAVGIRPFTR